jgi:hypothetical protein
LSERKGGVTVFHREEEKVIVGDQRGINTPRLITVTTIF